MNRTPTNQDGAERALGETKRMTRKAPRLSLKKAAAIVIARKNGLFPWLRRKMKQDRDGTFASKVLIVISKPCQNTDMTVIF